MANPFKALKKLKGRSLKEIRTRGEQAITARSEQIGLIGKLPSDEEFARLLDASTFDGEEFSAKNLFTKFYEQGKSSFFQSFAEREKTLEAFRRKFGGIVTALIIERAERLIEGRFDLLGFQNLDFGMAVDWHLEPIAQKRAPLKHWKQFDELATGDTGDKKIIWELNRHQHFFTLGTAFWLTGDERYAATFVRHLDSWMEQNPPSFGVNWISSLEVALRAVSWIWALHFFRDAQSFSPALFQKALKFLYLHGRHIEKYLSTFYSPNTHLTGEALALYYLGTQLKFFTRSEQWRRLGEEILLSELDRQILEDGVYFEQSTWYGRYTADFYTHFLILRNLDPDADENSAKNPAGNLQKQLDFLMYVTRPDGTTPLVGDDDGGRSLPLSESEPDDFRHLLSNGAVLFGRGDYKFVAKEICGETLWLFGAEGAKIFESVRKFPPEKTSKDFPAGGYYVMRDGWAETDNYLLIDGGNLGGLSGGHSHADSLAIDCAAGGATFLTDAGTYTYHESTELRNYFRSTVAHNTLSINEQNSSEPGGKFNWQTTAKSAVKSWIAEQRFDFFEGSHDGYSRFPHSPAVHERSVLFLKNDYWVVRDYVGTAGANDYQLNFHFDGGANPKIEAAANGGSCVSEMPEKKAGLRLFTFGDNGGWRRAEGWISRCYGNRVNAPFMRFAANGFGAQEFFTFILPSDSQMTAPEVFEAEVSGGRAFVVEYRDYRDLLIFADGKQIIRTEFFDTDFRFFWARLSGGESLPEEFVMTHGTRFNLDGRKIINHPQKLNFATARRLGNYLNIRTEENIFGLTLSPDRPATL